MSATEPIRNASESTVAKAVRTIYVAITPGAEFARKLHTTGEVPPSTLTDAPVT